MASCTSLVYTKLQFQKTFVFDGYPNLVLFSSIQIKYSNSSNYILQHVTQRILIVYTSSKVITSIH